MFNLNDYLNIYAFLIAFGIGLIYTYFTSPENIYVVKYPTPFNIGNVTYTDSVGSCYRYDIKDVNCKEDGKKLRKFRPQ